MDVIPGADRLLHARDSMSTVRPFSEEEDGLTEEQAWAIADEVDQRLLERGHRRTGYKLGWTSAAMREALGIDRPNYGSLWDFLEIHGILRMSHYRHPKAEPEFAFKATSPLAGADCTAQDVMEHGLWGVALEIVDPRWHSYSFTWLDNTADGSSAAGYVVGQFRPLTGSVEELALTMGCDGTRHTGHGRAVMGSPAEAVAHLVRRLAPKGVGLDRGMVVLTGGITPPVDLTPGLGITVNSPQLGSCTVRCHA